MIIEAIIFFTIVSILLGRVIFGRWFNHITLYCVPWGVSLSIFHSGLIKYYPLEAETWIYIIAAWLLFILGSATVPVARFSAGKNNTGKVLTLKAVDVKDDYVQKLQKVLWIFNIVLMLHAMYEVYNVIRLLGGDVLNFFTLANKLYDVRVKEGIPGSIPYFGQLVFFVAVLAGVYTSLVGRLRFVAFIPFLISVLTSLIQVVRALALIVAILFICAYFLNRRRVNYPSISKFAQSVKRLGAVFFLLALLLVTIEVVRNTRGIYERFSGQSRALKVMQKSGTSFISPSVIMYLSVHSGVFDQYLREDVEHVVWGRYSLAPMWRVISKFGFDTYVGFYQSWFYYTPVSANTGTYLRELHADYGPVGVIVIPYILGILCSFYWFRVHEKNTLTDITVLSLLYSVVAMSWFVMITQLGGWFLSLVVGIFVARKVDKKNEEKENMQQPTIMLGQSGWIKNDP